MAKPVALISNSVYSGIKYLRGKFKTSIAKINNSLIELNDGQQIIIITSLGEVQGREFSEYWIHPEYEDELVASVRARIR